MEDSLFSVCELNKSEATTNLNDQKFGREVIRIMELLRFTPNAEGEFIAKCAPDHFILPALAEHFTARFGETAWSIIDEKRGLCLRRLPGEQAKLFALKENSSENNPANCTCDTDEWEELWKHYHKIINNEQRNNPDLQRQLMPKRYWKYLVEMSNSHND